MKESKIKQVLEDLRNDDYYYGKEGKKFLSNSDIKQLLRNPEKFQQPWGDSSNFLHGKYVHVSILEPEKVKDFKIIDSSTRSTKKYKEESGGVMCLLENEMEHLNFLVDRLKKNDVSRGLLIEGEDIEYEVPGIKKLGSQWWKGKADVINRDRNFIIDIKTTADINKFKWNAKNYNYDSQAYIYSTIFGMDFLFVVIDKNTAEVRLFECDDSFIQGGALKVELAEQAYEKWILPENVDFNQRVEFDTLF